MDVYEFILIPSSIIVGLGIAELFGGVVRILRGELKAGPLHSLWVTVVFFAQVQWLWASWELQGRGTWVFPEFIIFILGPIGLYMVAAMLFPRSDPGDRLDRHLMERRRPFFIIFALTVASYSVSEWLVVSGRIGNQDLARLIVIALLGVLAVTGRKRVHLWGGITVLLGILWFTYFFTLQVG
jgi:hypothetical protein